MIYFDNAATTLHKPDGVAQAMVSALNTLGNSGRGAHNVTLDASRVIYGTREKLAQLFHVEDPLQIAFTCNATEALNIAIQGCFEPGDHVITTQCEHNSVLRPLYLLEKQGIELSIVQADQKGRICYNELEKLRKENTKAIVITHASNLTGNVTDLMFVSEFARKYHLLLIVDASQSAGIIPIDVGTMGIDILCFTGHKGLYGPQGTGGIVVRKGLEIRPLKVGGTGIRSYDKVHPPVMPTALEAGTLNGVGIAGLSAALDFILAEGVEAIHEREQILAKRFVDGILDIPNITIYGDLQCVRTGIISINLGEEDSGTVSDWLWEDAQIAVRAGAHCAPLMHQALGTEKQGAVRFSFSFFNTEKEVDTAIKTLRNLI